MVKCVFDTVCECLFSGKKKYFYSWFGVRNVLAACVKNVYMLESQTTCAPCCIHSAKLMLTLVPQLTWHNLGISSLHHGRIPTSHRSSVFQSVSWSNISSHKSISNQDGIWGPEQSSGPDLPFRMQPWNKLILFWLITTDSTEIFLFPPSTKTKSESIFWNLLDAVYLPLASRASEGLPQQFYQLIANESIKSSRTLKARPLSGV